MKRIIILAGVAVVILAGIFVSIITRDVRLVESDPDIQPAQEMSADSVHHTETSVSDKVKYSVTLPESLREIIAENHDIMFPTPDPNLEEIVKSYQTPDLDAETDATVAEVLKQQNEDSTPPEFLTHEEIVEELDYLFDLLKYGYGAYQYFGGDEVFEAVKQYMLARLSLMNDPLSNDTYINDLLVPCLKTVIADNHFRIGTQRIGIGNQIYMNEEYVVQKTEDGYTTVIDGRTYRILRAGEAFECLLPTLTSDGELAWMFALMQTGGEKYSQMDLGVDLEDMETQERSTQRILMFPVSDQYRASLSQELYTLDETDGITVLTNRRLYTNEGDPTLENFAATGRTVRDESVVILDLRCNRGGNSAYAFEWVRQYVLKQPPNYVFLTTTLYSKTANLINSSSTAAFPPSWIGSKYQGPESLSNKNLLIVLMDNGIGSSGESFIGYLRQLDNVVFVGTNTVGCLITGNIGSSVLPNSKRQINFGVQLNIRPDLSQFEGIGFMPDLWVPPGQSMERVIRFVERYKTVE